VPDHRRFLLGESLKFAMNGGMYQDDLRPVGLYIEKRIAQALSIFGHPAGAAACSQAIAKLLGSGKALETHANSVAWLTPKPRVSVPDHHWLLLGEYGSILLLEPIKDRQCGISTEIRSELYAPRPRPDGRLLLWRSSRLLLRW
jgi:hypothetical protein